MKVRTSGKSEVKAGPGMDWRTLLSCPGRWSWRFKVILVFLVAILSVQLLLAYHSSNLDDQPRDGGTSGAFAQLNSGGFPPVDDDDSNNPPSNSNHHHPPKEDFIRSISSQADEAGVGLGGVGGGVIGTHPLSSCRVQSRDALSAVNRAKTEDCKKQILDTVCAIESGTFYAQQLVSRCPRGNFTSGRPLGCFQDDQTNRLLDGYYVNNKETNSPKKCMEICLQSGFTYAGVQYSQECFCGNTSPPSSVQLPATSCDKKCPADDTAVCGGYFTMNVFETGISSEYLNSLELN